MSVSLRCVSAYELGCNENWSKLKLVSNQFSKSKHQSDLCWHFHIKKQNNFKITAKTNTAITQTKVQLRFVKCAPFTKITTRMFWKLFFFYSTNIAKINISSKISSGFGSALVNDATHFLNTSCLWKQSRNSRMRTCCSLLWMTAAGWQLLNISDTGYGREHSQTQRVN